VVVAAAMLGMTLMRIRARATAAQQSTVAAVAHSKGSGITMSLRMITNSRTAEDTHRMHMGVSHNSSSSTPRAAGLVVMGTRLSSSSSSRTPNADSGEMVLVR
jgi:ABC-type nitrate/sulfonate/bicarbonate transport system substrate-binding protein